MAKKIEMLKPVLHLSKGNTIGGEPKFGLREINNVLDLCTEHGIAILGLDLFRDSAEGYVTERMSSYEVPWGGGDWGEFVSSNNRKAMEFVAQNSGSESYFYLLTPASQSEYLDNCK